MAFIDTNNSCFSPGTQGKQIPFIYNVTMAVGARAANKFDDVLLVQYFLKNIWANPAAFQPPLPDPPTTDLELSGLFDPETELWIQAYQDNKNSQGEAIVTDARVDMAVPGGITPVNHVLYTIFFLNCDFQVARPDLPFDNIAQNDPNCPPELQNLFNSSPIVMGP
jgi:hypothetical protein